MKCRIIEAIYQGLYCLLKVRNAATIRNRYNQAPHLTQDTTWEGDKNTIRAKRSALSQQVKIDLRRKKYNMFWKTITCDPSIYIDDHPDLTVCSFMKNSIVLKGSNMPNLPLAGLL